VRPAPGGPDSGHDRSPLAQGHSNQEVAQELGIREQTVKNHLGSIMKKLGLNSRLEVGLFAAKKNMILRQPSKGPRPRGAPE
jgi:hypothetical protein